MSKTSFKAFCVEFYAKFRRMWRQCAMNETTSNNPDAIVDAMKHGRKYSIFSFVTGAGFLDLGFEDAGFAVEGDVVSPAETQRHRGGAMS